MPREEVRFRVDQSRGLVDTVFGRGDVQRGPVEKVRWVGAVGPFLRWRLQNLCGWKQRTVSGVWQDTAAARGGVLKQLTVDR